MKKLLAILMASAMVLTVVGCGGGGNSSSTGSESTSTPEGGEEVKFSSAMVTDVGGVNDQSFNQSAWEGLQTAQKDMGIEVKYIESKQEAEYGPNLEILADEGHDLIWGVGFMLQSAVMDAAAKNPDTMYALVDSDFGADAPKNTIGVLFRAQEPSFLVGYIAGKVTETGKVGFVGGVKGEVIDQFEYGFRAGVAYAAKELGKEITVDVQYANSFGDSGLGKSIAQKMYAEGCDIVFHAAGNVGVGVIEAAKENDKWVIGVDQDQNHLAPDNVLTSAMKMVGKAMNIVIQDMIDGKDLGGQTLVFGIKEGCAGIAPTSEKNVPEDVLADTIVLEEKIVSEEIVPPYSEDTFNAFIESLAK